MITNTAIVPRHPPPSLYAPYPEMIPLSQLFIPENLKSQLELLIPKCTKKYREHLPKILQYPS